MHVGTGGYEHQVVLAVMSDGSQGKGSLPCWEFRDEGTCSKPKGTCNFSHAKHLGKDECTDEMYKKIGLCGTWAKCTAYHKPCNEQEWDGRTKFEAFEELKKYKDEKKGGKNNGPRK